MNIAIVAVLLKDFCKPFLCELESGRYPTPEDKLEAVRIAASDAGNDEIVWFCDWIEIQKLTRSFFPEVEP